MAFGRKKDEEAEAPPADPTGWLLDSGIAEVLIMHTVEIKYMCMLFYTFFHGRWNGWRDIPMIPWLCASGIQARDAACC